MTAPHRILLTVVLTIAALQARAVDLVQEFYVPLPENQVQLTMKALYPSVGSQMNSVISIVSTTDGTVIHYDHWEDGYEADLEHPVQASTEIWGDGNAANGAPPGNAADLLNRGSVVALRNTVDLPRSPSVRRYDGRDRIGSTTALAASRAEWATNPGTVLAGSPEMLPVREYGTRFEIPIGQNLGAIDNGMFEYVGAFIQAAQDNTGCTWTDRSGVVSVLPLIHQGASQHRNGGVRSGDRLVCDKPVQLHLISGDIGANYESRWYLIYPVDRWSDQYFSPVGTAADGDATYVFLYNPDDAASITVTVETLTGSTTVTVPPNGSARQQLPVSSGAHLFTTDGKPFDALATVGANPAANNVHDWGTSLVPFGAMTSQLVVGWAPGDANQPPTTSGNPLWLFAERDTMLYIDYQGNGGPNTAPNGLPYDVTVPIRHLESRIVAAPNHDNTGTRVFTIDGALITGAWGQNPAVAGPASPFLDMGYTLLPFPVPKIEKSAALCPGGDVNNNGQPNLGDTLCYSLRISNAGLTTLSARNLVDDLGAGGLQYLPGTTTRDAVAIPDRPSAPVFPLTSPGYVIGDIPPATTTVITYQARIMAAGRLTNSVQLGSDVRTSHVVDVPPATPAACTLSFTDGGGATVTQYGAGDTLRLRLANADLNLNPAVAETVTVVVANPAAGTKDTEVVTLTETGVNSGIFTGSLPASPTDGQTANDGTLFFQIGDTAQVSSTLSACAPATAGIATPTRTKTLYLRSDTTDGDTSGRLNRTDPGAAPEDNSTSSTAVLGGSAAIAVDNTSTGTGQGAIASLTVSHATGTGSNRLMLVGIAYEADDSSSVSVSSVTYGGVALTRVGSRVTQGEARTEIWRLVAPASGTANLVVNFSNAGSTDAMVVGVTTFTGVDQTTPLRTNAGGNLLTVNDGTSTLPFVNGVTSATGDRIFSTVALDDARGLTTAPAQTALWTRNMGQVVPVPNTPGDGISGGGATNPGAATVNVSWGTSGNDDWAIAAVSIRPATRPATATFTQDPVLAGALTLPAGAQPSALVHYTVDSGSMPASPAVTATLRRGATVIATSTGAAASGGLLTFSFAPLAAAVTASAGEALALDITTTQVGVTFSLDYDSATRRSRIDLPTPTVIGIDSFGLYDAPHPGGSLAVSASNGQTLYARAVVRDPFGAYDINGIDLVIDGPGCDLTATLGDAHIVASTAGSRTYEYPWKTGACVGLYELVATAREGTEGTVTATAATQIPISSTDTGTPAIVQFIDGANADKTTYATSQQVCLRITDLDQAGRSEPITVVVTGSLSGAQAPLALTETPPGSGIFQGCFGAPGGSTPFVNNDALSARYTDPTDSTDIATDAAVITTSTPPSLLLAKTRLTPASGTALVGEPVVYEITATNPGTSPLGTVALTDTFSSGCYGFQSASMTPGATGAGSLGWPNVGPIAGGASVRIQVSLVATAACNTTQAVNSVSATGDATAGPATATVTIAPTADLGITKTNAATTVSSGATTTYTLVVTNQGPGAANNAVIRDPAAAGLTKTGTPTCSAENGAVCPPGLTLAGLEAPGGITIPTLPSGGRLTLTVQATVTATDGGVANTATVAPPAGISDPNPANDEATDGLDTVERVADLAITKDDGKTRVDAGGVTTYTVTVTNNGPSSVTGAVLSDPAATGLSKTAVACAAAPGVCTTAPSVAQLESGSFPLPELAAGASYRLTVTASVTATDGSVANTATVAPPSGARDPTPGNDTATDTDTVDPVADLAITKDDGITRVNAGGVTTYTVTVTNNGPSSVTGAILSDPAVSGLYKTAVACATAAPGACVTAPSVMQLESGGFALPALAPNATYRLEVTAGVAAFASGSLANSASIAPPAGTRDPTPGNDAATDTNGVNDGRIGDFVWYDSNRDGIQDASEPGLAGVPVILYAADGVTEVARTLSDGSGRYQFAGLPDGDYVLHFTPSTDYRLSPVNAGAGALQDSFDSDPSPADFRVGVTVSGGAANPTVDVGFHREDADGAVIPPARLADRVWHDTDGDGIQDAGEPGLGGVTVELLGAGNLVLATRVSDATGFYEFAGLPAGSYQLRFTSPAGYVPSPRDQGGDDALDSDADPGTGLTGAIAVAAGQTLTDTDAGFTLAAGNPARLGDRVWYDTNGNGIQDGGEPGLPGVRVNLYDRTGARLLQVALTGVDGAYRFDGLPAGDYLLEIVRPTTGHVFSPSGQGTAATDSNPDPATGRAPVTLTAGQNDVDADAGLRVSGQAPITVGNYVWLDANDDRAPQAGEGLAAIDVVLYDSLGFPLARRTTDASDANYGFGGLAAGGSYRIAIDTRTLSGRVQIADPDAVLDHRTDLVNQSASTAAVDFGYLQPRTGLSIVKTADDGSDAQQVRSGGTARFRITVSNTGNLAVRPVVVTDPDAQGCAFTLPDGLAPGATHVHDYDPGTVGQVDPCARVNVTADFINEATAAGQPVDGNGLPVGAELSASDDTTVDVIHPALALTKTALNSPIAVDGANPTGTARFSLTVTNTGDVALGNVTVADALGDCARGPADIAALASLPPADQAPANTVTYACDVPGQGASFINQAEATGQPPVGDPVTAQAQAAFEIIPAGLTVTKTPGEQTLHAGGSARFRITVTNTSATATLKNVSVVDPNTPACGRSDIGDLAPGASVTWPPAPDFCTRDNVTADFINEVTATGTVDGTSQQLTASGVASVKVINPSLRLTKLTNDADGLTLRKATLVTWEYIVENTGDVPLTSIGVSDSDTTLAVSCPFASLAPGGAMTCYGFGPAIAGPYANTATVSGQSPIAETVTATDDSRYAGIDPGAIGNRVWLDENGDGIADAGEPGLPGLTVELRDATDATVATLLTDADGGYRFADVPPGTWTVVVTPRAGLHATFDEDGTATPHRSTVTLAGGEFHSGADFGYNWVPAGDSDSPAPGATGAIGDRVWNDADGDGLQDPGESGLAGVQVAILVDPDGDGVYDTPFTGATDAAGNPLPTGLATTDAAGRFVFDGLPAGSYVLDIRGGVPAGWRQTGDPDGPGSADGRTTLPIVLAPGDVFVNADFGYDAPAGTRGSAIGQRLWLDANVNGIQDAGEPGLAGVTVVLRDGAGGILATTRTDALGEYRFDGLPAGTYTVAVTDTDALLTGLIPATDPDHPGTINDGMTPDPVKFDQSSSLSVDGLADALDRDFGYMPPGMHDYFDTVPGLVGAAGLIGDRVFLDRNGDRAFDPGEGLQGVAVELWDPASSRRVATAVTNADGLYAFGHVNVNRDWQVRVNVATLPGAGVGLWNVLDPDEPGPCTVCDSASTVTRLSLTGNLNLMQDFGFSADNPATPGDESFRLGGKLWIDSDADGTLDADEVDAHIAGVTLELRDGAGRVVARATSDGVGDYRFAGLPAGVWTVQITDTQEILDGWWHSLGSQDPAADGQSRSDPYTVVLGAGVDNVPVDFGYYLAGGTLGNRVWNDANGNGIQDAGEGGLAGVRLTLRVVYPNTDSSNVVVASDASGAYRFGNLLLDESFDGVGPGEPSFTLIAAIPAGRTPSPLNAPGSSPKTDSDDPAGTSATPRKGQTAIAILANPANEGDNASHDFGSYAPATVSGHLYIDTDGNGAQDAGEPDLAGVDVVITDASGVPRRVSTDADGNYQATVISGSVTVDVDETDPRYPAGYTRTEGTDPTTLTTTDGVDNDAGNDGYAPIGLTGTVSGHVYIDTNGNGAQDPGEPDAANVDVLVTDVNGGSRTVRTNATGDYLATVPEGSVTADIDETDLPSGYTRTEGADPTTLAATKGTNTFLGNHGYAPPPGLLGTVTGHLYIDTNGNGAQDPGEPDLANIDVIITDVNGGTRTVVTDANGNYRADIVPAGLARVRVDLNDPQLPAGYTQTEGDNPTEVPVQGAQSAGAGNDGFAPPAGQRGTVTGHLYLDGNGNGVQDPGEADLADVDVVITDVNGGSFRVTTGGNGDYTVSGVPAGRASVKVDTTDPQFPSGYRQTEGDDPTTVTVVGGASVDAGNDGWQPPVGSIGNRVWLDENGNGVQDAGEAGIPGRRVELRSADGANLIASTLTDALGGYRFNHVPAGLVYQIRVTAPAGLEPTFDSDGIVTPGLSQTPIVVAGVEHDDLDFGYNWVTPADRTQPAATTTGAIGDRVWNDADGDGRQDPGESGLAGVSVRLFHDPDGDGVYDTPYAGARDADGNLLNGGVAITDASGQYVFDDLPPGAWVIAIDPGSLPAGIGWTPSGDPDGVFDGSTTSPVVLAPGDVWVNADFGYRPARGSRLGDRIYLDADGNGLDDGGEPGIAGVSVALLDKTGRVMATDVTDASGRYGFPGLPAGDYRVVVTDSAHVLGERVQRGDPDGGNDGSAAANPDGVSDNDDLDFGYAPLGPGAGRGLIGDTVFIDRDGNQAYDPGEGLEGVVVNLFDGFGLSLGSTLTDENGRFAFGGLDPDGVYRVRVDGATLPAGLLAYLDPDEPGPCLVCDGQGQAVLTPAAPVNLAMDFGYRASLPRSIGGSVWNDRDGDGVRLGEPVGLAGVTLELRDALGRVVGMTVTDANGDYRFTGLPAGRYRVFLTDADRRLDGYWKTEGPNPGADGNSQVDGYAVSLSGADDFTADFGFFAEGAALGNRVWLDDDRNGRQDGGESGLAGVRVTLVVTYPDTGARINVVTRSDAQGGFRLGNLLLDERYNGIGSGQPGHVLSATAPAGHWPTVTGAGGNPALDSDDPAGTTIAGLVRGDGDTVPRANPADEPVNAWHDFGFLPNTDVAVVIDGLPTAAAPNTLVTGTVTCTNLSAFTASQVACGVTGGRLDNCRVGSTAVGLPLTSLAAGQAIVCDLIATTPASGRLQVRATTDARQDGNPANNAAEADVGTDPSFSPPGLSKRFVPEVIQLNQFSVLILELGNANGFALELQQDLVDDLPAGLHLVASPNPNGDLGGLTACPGSFQATALATRVTYRAGSTIPPGGCALSVRVTGGVKGGWYDNLIAAGALATQAGRNPAPAQARLYVDPADLALTKTLDTPGPYKVGQKVDFTLTIVNNGPDLATGVVVTDTMTRLKLLSVSGGGCTQFPCGLGNLASGASVTLKVTARIRSPGEFVNTATVGAASPVDPQSANNSATVKGLGVGRSICADDATRNGFCFPRL